MPVQYETPQTIFDSRASQYDHKPFRRFMYTMLDHAVMNAIPKVKSYPQAILDVGCGTGRFLGHMEKQFPQTQLTGVDISPGMITIAKRKVASNSLFDFHIASADKLPPSFNNRFDLAFSIISFHYWKRPIVSLREIHRVVRPGGFFILADGFVTEGLLGSLPRVYFKLFRKERSEEYFYSAEKIGQMFGEADWRVLEQRQIWLLGGTILITVGQRA